MVKRKQIMKIQIFLSSVLAFEILNLNSALGGLILDFLFPFVLLLFLPSSKADYQIFFSPLQKIIQHTLYGFQIFLRQLCYCFKILL